jgi:NAD dependent epimerase/dehydratase family enzyme
MRILVTGASGLIGSAMVPFLTTGGHTVVRLGRSGRGADTIMWDPAVGSIDRAALEGFDAVVHLAGESMSRGGALATMLAPLMFGVGGPAGRGSQFMSWIAHDDVFDAVLFALTTPTLTAE